MLALLLAKASGLDWELKYWLFGKRLAGKIIILMRIYVFLSKVEMSSEILRFEVDITSWAVVHFSSIAVDRYYNLDDWFCP